jgi:hypothetical protein
MAASTISDSDVKASEAAGRVSLGSEVISMSTSLTLLTLLTPLTLLTLLTLRILVQTRGLRFKNTNFCPVSLRDDQLLVPGKDAMGVRIGTQVSPPNNPA